MIEYLLSLSLLLIPSFNQKRLEAAEAIYLKSLQDMWIATGIMCEEDRSKYFTGRWSEEYDRKIMIERTALMNSTTPPFSDEKYLPTLGYCTYAYEIQNKYLKYLSSIYKWGTPSERRLIETVLADLKKRQYIYYTIACVHENVMHTGKRATMEDLRFAVGAEAYNARKWPLPLPPEAYYFDWPISVLVIEYEK